MEPDNTYYVLTCFMTINSIGAKDLFWNNMTSWYTGSDYIHIESFFYPDQDTWRITQHDRGGFYKDKQYTSPGWKSVKTMLTRQQYLDLRQAFDDYNGSIFDESALKWYLCFPSGCCTMTNRGYTMCSHVVADVYSRPEIGIFKDRDDLIPFTKNTPAILYDLIRALPTTEHNAMPTPVINRNVNYMTPANLLKVGQKLSLKK